MRAQTGKQSRAIARRYYKLMEPYTDEVSVTQESDIDLSINDSFVA